MMLRRVAFGAAAVTFAFLAAANVVLWHSAAWTPLVIYGAVLCALAIFERGRYRPRVPSGSAWEATGERFYDPATGAATEVYYDPATGARQYRT